jgi:methyl-accepting chemotaxis protein/carbonic anhydrase
MIRFKTIALTAVILATVGSYAVAGGTASKPSPDAVVSMLQAGNNRFVNGKSKHRHTNAARLRQAGSENQGNHAYATVITCSDSRVPVERVFDAGVMDIFVIRVAGNVCDTDEIGSIEYGLAHVNTPVLVVLGHTQCGAVTAVTAAVQGKGHPLERNIPQLVDNIEPAVRRAMANNPGVEGSKLISAGIEENVWQSIEDLFRESPSTRQLVKSGKVKVVGAIYEVGTGEVLWAPQSITSDILARVEADPSRAMNAMAGGGHGGGDSHGGGHGAAAGSGHAGIGMSGWVAKLGKSGNFNQPAVHIVNRPAFGVTAGHAESLSPQKGLHSSSTRVYVFWAATGLTMLLTIFLALSMAKSEGADGESHLRFTFSSKLVLALGAMASLIFMVSTQSLSGQQGAAENLHHLEDLAEDSSLIESIQRDALLVRLSVTDFQTTNSDQSLKEYSDAAADMAGQLEKARSDIQDPSLAGRIKEISEVLEDYEGYFEELVHATDKRNGIVSGQLDTTGARLTLLLEAIIETAQEDGKILIALEAAEALDFLALARVAASNYLRTGSEADAREAIVELDKGEEFINLLHNDVKDPTRKKWLLEAEEGYAFYAVQLESTIDHVHECNSLVNDHLSVLGKQVAHIGEGLVDSIHEQLAEAKIVIEEAGAARVTKATVICIFSVAAALLVAFFLTRIFRNGIGALVDRLKDIAQGEGDLTKRVDQDRGDELGELGLWFNTFIKRVHDVILEVGGATRDVASAATEIAASSEQMAQGMGEQSTQVMQISSAIEQMSASVIEVARKSGDAANNAAESGRVAEQGGEVVDQTITGMRSISEAVTAGAASVAELGKRGDQIGQIIEVINDIADQTNLLALNAAIEAARAGEHGRGFAVVADEVRKLADRTTKATEEIGESIKAIQSETGEAVDKMNAGTEQVTTGVESATQAGESLRKIVNTARDVAGMIQSIAAAAEEQSAASEEVSRSVEAVSSVTRQATEGANQAAQAASQLSTKAEQLQVLVGRFKTEAS